MDQKKQVGSRYHAGVFDLPVTGETSTHGVGASTEAIGGHFGLGWYEHFKDARTGEIYHVHCSDGVNFSKGAYSGDDEQWRNDIYYAIVSRCHDAAKSGVAEIRVSRNERVCMQGFTHAVWLESAIGRADGEQSKDGLEGGLVGHCLGTPIICDIELEDNLPPRPAQSVAV